MTRIDVASDRTAGIVVDQDPTGGLEARRGDGHALGLEGPTTSAVPDVTGQDVSMAQTILETRDSHPRRVSRTPTTPPSTASSPRRTRPAGRRQAELDRRPVRRALRRHADRDGPTTPDAVTGRLRVAVLAGGRSSEHEISVASARSVGAALDPARYETTTIEIDRDGRWELVAGGRRSRRRQRPSRRSPSSHRRRRARSARSTSCCRSSTARSGRTGPSRGCSSCRGRVRRRGRRSLGAVHGQGPVQGASCAIAASRSRGTSRSATAIRPTTLHVPVSS